MLSDGKVDDRPLSSSFLLISFAKLGIEISKRPIASILHVVDAASNGRQSAFCSHHFRFGFFFFNARK